MTFTEEQITEIYVATFNRAPDAAGLNYWMNDSGFESIEDVAGSFFDSTEAQTFYSDATTSTEMVQSAYQNLFGRDADAEGLDYWTNELDTGSFSQSLMLQAMINGAVDEDALLIQNKTAVGIDYANRGIDDAETASTILQNITYDASTIDDAYSFMSSMGFDRIYDFSDELDTGFENTDINNLIDEMQGGFGDFETGINIEDMGNFTNVNLGGFTGSTFGGGSFGGMMSFEYIDSQTDDELYLDTDTTSDTDVDIVGVDDTTIATVDTIA